MRVRWARGWSPELGPAALAALAGAALVATASDQPAESRGMYAGVVARLSTPSGWAWALRAAIVLTAPLAGLGVAAYAVAALVETVTAPPTASPAVDWRRSTGTGMLGLA